MHLYCLKNKNILKKKNTPTEPTAPALIRRACYVAMLGYVTKTSIYTLLFQVTKQTAFHKPTYTSLLHSLEDTRSHCIRTGYTSCRCLGICGLDQLEWTEVAKILEQVFMGTGITITIYSLPWTAASMN
uniref:Uncharacterized protein n=1 Tax=Acanthochromis polyacanthus TaxID=80966 RepID=A0A3Q1H3J2_9TELE